MQIATRSNTEISLHSDAVSADVPPVQGLTPLAPDVLMLVGGGDTIVCFPE
jgi:hypothetical protein